MGAAPNRDVEGAGEGAPKTPGAPNSPVDGAGARRYNGKDSFTHASAAIYEKELRQSSKQSLTRIVTEQTST